jgi:hypothetical protein
MTFVKKNKLKYNMIDISSIQIIYLFLVILVKPISIKINLFFILQIMYIVVKILNIF